MPSYLIRINFPKFKKSFLCFSAQVIQLKVPTYSLSGFLIILGSYCIGHWHEIKINSFLYSQRRTLLMVTLKLHKFHNIFNLNQFVRKRTRLFAGHGFVISPNLLTKLLVSSELWIATELPE